MPRRAKRAHVRTPPGSAGCSRPSRHCGRRHGPRVAPCGGRAVLGGTGRDDHLAPRLARVSRQGRRASLDRRARPARRAPVARPPRSAALRAGGRLAATGRREPSRCSRSMGYRAKARSRRSCSADRFLWASDYIQTLAQPTQYLDEVAAAVSRMHIDPLRVAAEHLPLSDWATAVALVHRRS